MWERCYILQAAVVGFEKGFLKVAVHSILLIEKQTWNKFNFDVNIVPADGLAPLGARPSPGTMFTFKLCVRTSAGKVTTKSVYKKNMLDLP